jgi:hypothetical protein
MTIKDRMKLYVSERPSENAFLRQESRPKFRHGFVFASIAGSCEKSALKKDGSNTSIY